MKTTVEIPDPLFRAAREYCAGRNLSFRQLIESGLRLAIEQPPSVTRFRLKPFGFRGQGQQIQEWTAIRQAIYEGRGDSSVPIEPRRPKTR